MTLGKKLSNYRKMLGFTQQQLGEYLNLSAQAVSKWENDLAEPDIATLKSLANLYSLTVDELLNSNNEDFQPKSQTAEASFNDGGAKLETIGFCKNCGIVVTEENIGERTPVVLCKDCYEEKCKNEELQRLERQRAAKEAELEHQRRLDEIEDKKKKISNDMKHKVKVSSIVAGIITLVFFVLWVMLLVNNFDFGLLVTGLILGASIFTFVSLLFYDTAVLDVLEYMGTASINWPGIIFDLDLEGLAFLIIVKALFAALGFIFGLVCAVLGVFVSMFISIFIYPFVMHNMKISIKNGEESKYVI